MFCNNTNQLSVRVSATWTRPPNSVFTRLSSFPCSTPFKVAFHLGTRHSTTCWFVLHHSACWSCSSLRHSVYSVLGWSDWIRWKERTRRPLFNDNKSTGTEYIKYDRQAGARAASQWESKDSWEASGDQGSQRAANQLLLYTWGDHLLHNARRYAVLINEHLTTSLSNLHVIILE